MKDMKFVTLLGATGDVRQEMHEGRQWTVVPVVALVEGVIRAVNAPAPELVRQGLFSKRLSKWEEKPVFAGHPMRNGEPLDGLLPDVLPNSFGLVRNATADHSLRMEAWLDHVRCVEGTPGGRILGRATAITPKSLEVSVGAWVRTAQGEGTWTNGKRYAAEWIDWEPNHLALLDEGQRGACDIEMGCGTHRYAMRVAKDGELELVAAEFDESKHPRDERGRWTHSFSSLSESGARSYLKEIEASGGSGIIEPKGRYHVVRYKLSKGGWGDDVKYSFRRPSKLTGLEGLEEGVDEVESRTLFQKVLSLFRSLMPRGWGDDEVKQELREALDLAEPLMRTGGGEIVRVKNDAVVYCLYPPQNYYDAPMGPGAKMTYWQRNYSFDTATQTFIVSAERTQVEPTTHYEPYRISESQEMVESTIKAACGCGGKTLAASAAQGDIMEKKDRIAALVANPHSAVKSLKMLEAATDEELTGLETQAGTLKTAADKSSKDAADKVEVDKKDAERKVEEARVVPAAVSAPAPAIETEEQVLARFPGIDAVVKSHRAAEAAQKGELVKGIRAASQAFTEEQLIAKPLDELKQLAALAKVEAPVDYSLRGVPRAAAAAAGDLQQFVPPDPYAKDLAAAK